MKYDFDTVHNRRGTASYKWDVAENELPLWVGDMDFRTAPCVTEAILARAEKGIFGYNTVPDEWYDAYIGHWKAHGFTMRKEWLQFCTGVIPAVTSIVKRVTNAGDNVVLQTPVYDIFFHSVENTGRHVLENPLAYENGVYKIDFEDLERKLSHPLTTMMIVCNPHNPTGMIPAREELARIGALCRKYGVTVLSDEIHCDLTDSGYAYTPFAAASEENARGSVVCLAASKAFNLAGLQSAAVVVPDERLRRIIVRGLNADEVAEPNSFAVCATAAALMSGDAWLRELRAYLTENKRFAARYIREELPALAVVSQHATFFLWIDCAAVTHDADELRDFLRARTGLVLTSGTAFRGGGETFLRMNAACPRTTLTDGLQRLREGIALYTARRASV